jgi:hypothetical protein
VFLERLAAEDLGMPLTVPEPGELALAAAGLAFIAWRSSAHRSA